MGGKSRREIPADAVWWLALALAVAIVLVINPVGYVGGRSDDWQYLNAARCWRELGPCFPHDHWQSRWPVIAPLAVITALFGESRTSAELAPLVASVACLALVVTIGNSRLGKPVGWIAALLLVATPIFTVHVLKPTAEPIELALILAGSYAALRWIDRGSWPSAFASGLSLSLAIQVRETALVAALFAAAYALYRRRPEPGSLAAGLGGFALPFIIEFATFAAIAGDPLWRLRLAVRHVQLPSSELLGPIDSKHPPFFNKNYIAHWNLSPGVHIHWAVDGLINIFLNVVAGLSLSLTPVLLLFARRRIGGSRTRSSLELWCAAVAYIGILIYAFAIDPKPRMFLPSLVAANLALALLSWSLWQGGYRALAGAIWATAAALGVAYVYAFPQNIPAERQAMVWMRAYPNQIETDTTTRKTLAFVRDVARLPPIGSGREMLLIETTEPCNAWLQHTGLALSSVSLAGEVKRSRASGRYQDLGFSLCLFRYQTDSRQGELNKFPREHR